MHHPNNCDLLLDGHPTAPELELEPEPEPAPEPKAEGSQDGGSEQASPREEDPENNPVRDAMHMITFIKCTLYIK